MNLCYKALGEAARKSLEELMAEGRYEYQSEFARKYFNEGRVEGRDEGRDEGREEAEASVRCEAILAFLEFRGLPLSPEQRSRITSTKDLPTLRRWMERAREVDSTDQLFS